MNEIFGAGGFVVGGPGELEKDLVAGEFEEGELVALRGGFTLFFGVAEVFVEGDGGIEVLDADAGVEEADHGGRNLG